MARFAAHESIPPYGLSERLERRVLELGLTENLEQLAKDGYTVLRDAAAPELTDRIRAAIKRLVQETETDLKGRVAALLLGRDPVFELAVLNPKLLTLVEFVCGQAALLSFLAGSVRTLSPVFLPLHADQSYLPAPFPEHNTLLTACWACDDFTKAGGSTKVIPGSHRLRRHPSAEEQQAEEGAVPVECPRGSIVLWDGYVWHGNYPRQLPGERVVLHMTYCRLALRPLENYDHLGEDFLARNPPEMAALLGRGSVFGSSTVTSGSVDRSLQKRTMQQVKGHSEPPTA